ncbi:uncharacterized protein LOC107043599 [Diachasma alloeum]|uniref:uncharacterized protein LOC107043599 n=1 Tax=Diachasma alloeum TaxID=454923 RepID=UPI000738518C|nr:uncharacterized protein LOC107043599 [Diachasma alloeum]
MDRLMLTIFVIVITASLLRAERPVDLKDFIEGDKKLFMGGTLAEIFQATSDMADQIRIHVHPIEGTNYILSSSPTKERIFRHMENLERSMTGINELHEEYQYYLSHTNVTNPHTLRDFAEKTVSRDNDIIKNLNDISCIILLNKGVDPFDSLLILHLIELKLTSSSSCDYPRSPHDFIYSLYRRIMQTEKLALHMFRFSYKTLEGFHNSSFASEVDAKEKRFAKFTQAYKDVFEATLRLSPRTLRRCLPMGPHKRGITFHEFERLLGTVVVHETALRKSGSCFGACSDGDRQLYEKYDACFKGDYEELGRKLGPHFCYGSVRDCMFKRSPVSVCMENEGDTNSRRRYHWFMDGLDKVYGKNNQGCPGKLRTFDEWWRYFTYCEICVCTCIEDSYEGNVLKFVSLREVVSNVTDNMIVTGLQLVNTGSIIQLKIQTSRLAPGGTVAPRSSSWQKSEDLSYSQTESVKRRKYVFFESSVNILEPEKDIAIFTEANRAINLDALHVPTDSLITGVRFSRKSEERGKPIQLEIRATRFDYNSGKLLDIDASRWITADDMKSTLDAYKSERKQIQNQKDTENPLETPPTIPIFEPNRWVQLEKTSLEKDAGQTVVPLLDGLKISARPPVPLTGIDFFLKSAEGYGGFISFRITSLNRTEYMDVDDISV